MKPKEIYGYTPIKIEKECYCLIKYDFNFESVNWEKNKRVECHYYADECFDGRRGWEFFSVWYKRKPVMLCAGAGRENQDVTEEFITNKTLYKEMVIYLQTLSDESDNALGDRLYSENSDIKDLPTFYGYGLSNFYNPKTVRPKYKVGDIVLAKILDNHLRPSSNMINSRCRITEVYKFNPFITYHAIQLDRLWDCNRDKIITKKNKGYIGAHFNDSSVVKLLKKGKN